MFVHVLLYRLATNLRRILLLQLITARVCEAHPVRESAHPNQFEHLEPTPPT